MQRPAAHVTCWQAYSSQRTAGEGCGGGASRPPPPAGPPPACAPPAPSSCDRKPPALRPLASAFIAGAFTWILGPAVQKTLKRCDAQVPADCVLQPASLEMQQEQCYTYIIEPTDGLPALLNKSLDTMHLACLSVRITHTLHPMKTYVSHSRVLQPLAEALAAVQRGLPRCKDRRRNKSYADTRQCRSPGPALHGLAVPQAEVLPPIQRGHLRGGRVRAGARGPGPATAPRRRNVLVAAQMLLVVGQRNVEVKRVAAVREHEPLRAHSLSAQCSRTPTEGQQGDLPGFQVQRRWRLSSLTEGTGHATRREAGAQDTACSDSGALRTYKGMAARRRVHQAQHEAA